MNAEVRGKRGPNRWVIHVHCSVHGGPRGFTTLRRARVDCTGSCGAALAQRLRTTGVEMIEINQPDKATRRRAGKTDTPMPKPPPGRCSPAGPQASVPLTAPAPNTHSIAVHQVTGYGSAHDQVIVIQLCTNAALPRLLTLN